MPATTPLESVEKEFIANETRLFMMRRLHGSHVDRDFLWRTHDLEKMVLDRLTQETGGLLSEYVASLIRFGWAGYMLEFKLPPGTRRTHKWKVQFRGAAAEKHKKTNYYFPGALTTLPRRAGRTLMRKPEVVARQLTYSLKQFTAD